MKQKETLLNTMGINLSRETFEEFGEDHVGTSLQTPLREDAFEMDDDLKVELIVPSSWLVWLKPGSAWS